MLAAPLVKVLGVDLPSTPKVAAGATIRSRRVVLATPGYKQIVTLNFFLDLGRVSNLIACLQSHVNSLATILLHPKNYELLDP